MDPFLPPLCDRDPCLEILERGGILLLPVDTVHGLACRADLEPAVDALYRLKRRPEDKAFALVFPSVGALFREVEPLAGERDALSALLPGPVTAVISATPASRRRFPRWNPTLGVRVPGACPASSLLDSLPWPLALTSANLASCPTWDGLSPLDPELASGISARIGGLPPLANPSTVIRLEPGGWSLLRPGAMDEESLVSRLGPQRRPLP